MRGPGRPLRSSTRSPFTVSSGRVQAPGTRLRIDNVPPVTGATPSRTTRKNGFRTTHIQIQTFEDNGAFESLHAGLAQGYPSLDRIRFVRREAEASISAPWIRSQQNETVEKTGMEDAEGAPSDLSSGPFCI